MAKQQIKTENLAKQQIKTENLAKQQIKKEFINSFGNNTNINATLWSSEFEKYKKFRSNLDSKLNILNIDNVNYLSTINEEKKRLQNLRK